MWRRVNFNLALIQHFCLNVSVQFSQCKQITIIQRIHLPEKAHLLAGLLFTMTKFIVERQTGNNNLPFIIDEIFTLWYGWLRIFPVWSYFSPGQWAQRKLHMVPLGGNREMLISSGVDFLSARKSNLRHWSRNMVLPELHVFLDVWISLKLGSRVRWTGLWRDTFPYHSICNYIHLLNNCLNRALAGVSTRWPKWLGSPHMPADLLESVGSTLRKIKACLLPGHLCEHARTRKAENTQSNIAWLLWWQWVLQKEWIMSRALYRQLLGFSDSDCLIICKFFDMNLKQSSDRNRPCIFMLKWAYFIMFCYV